MPLLTHEPLHPVTTADELLGIALALEEEAVRRYTQLAALMDRRGETGVAATFRALILEEEGHAVAVRHWGASLGLPEADPSRFVWRLPPDIAASWDELTDRTSLSPYQALSLAVLNEQRAFAFYSYIAAHAEAEPVRRNAESLAGEELRHAALLRRERRAAFRRERGHGAGQPERVTSVEDLQRVTDALLSAAAAELAGLAARLRALGDADGAALTDRIAEAAQWAVTPSAAITPAPSPAGSIPAGHSSATDALRAALAVTERVAERFSDIAAQADDEAVLTEALRLQELVVGHLALLAERLHGRS
ncbi:ferritin family protein [Azospirillum sp. TSO35-2]|uniref:ferritin-like domain-containing protein n=1 Tax=Azospirillum sp. TSO35-2 TaxID=716796 RepID=UPI000D657471|nr:ferritin family protein [Azospirillum sp. TSO35-2]